MKKVLSSLVLLLLLSAAAHAQRLVAHASYEGPENSFNNTILVPAGEDKVVSYGNSVNQLLCYDASLKVIWKSEALRRKEQFVGDLTVHHDTIAAFAIRQEAGTKAEMVVLQQYSLATGKLINEQKVCGLAKDRPKGFPVGKLSPNRDRVYFITYATEGEHTAVTYTRYTFSTHETATGAFEIPAKSGKVLEPVVSDEKVVFVAGLSDTESGIYVHKAGSERVTTHRLEMPDHKHVKAQLYGTGPDAYVVVHAQNKDHVTQSLTITKVNLADGSLHTSKELPPGDKKDFLHVTNLHVFPNGRVCLLVEPFFNRYEGKSGNLEQYTHICGNLYYFITDENLRLVHQGKIEKNQSLMTFGNMAPTLSHASLLADNAVHVFYSQIKQSSFYARIDMTGKTSLQKIEDGLDKGNFNLMPDFVYLNGSGTMYAKTWKGLSLYLVKVDVGGKGKLSLENNK